ncbi:hypothetical protein Pmani_020968 [Petrolisthes manimaculis]|uniref:Uncharacterized protein n=1 Tax=Petrolisthes manimaculis TaxID=1843537 RepID=A0AAE1PHB4_9EUCA|nr:hypothetical protein Pmani_020968 [Petrolisthes manimaculis]
MPMWYLSYQFLGTTPEYWCRVPELIEANWTQEQIISLSVPLRAPGDDRLNECLMNNYNYTHAAVLGFNETMNNVSAVSNTEDDNLLLPCDTRIYNTSQHEKSLVTEWDLTCEKRPLFSTTQSVSHAGTLVGSAVFGHLFGV